MTLTLEQLQRLKLNLPRPTFEGERLETAVPTLVPLTVPPEVSPPAETTIILEAVRVAMPHRVPRLRWQLNCNLAL